MYDTVGNHKLMVFFYAYRLSLLMDFRFHTLRLTYTSNLPSGGVRPKDV